MLDARTIRQRLAAGDTFSLAEVRQWASNLDDLDRCAAVYDVFGTAYSRIRPEPDMEEVCGFLTKYLLRCVRGNVQDHDHIPTGYEAAHDLAACLKRWANKLPATNAMLCEAAGQVAQAFQNADAAEQDRLLNGLLEHALDDKAVRPYFAAWQTDPRLSTFWSAAMQWAECQAV